MKINLILIAILIASCFTGNGQTFELPTTNTRATITQRVAVTDIDLQYNRPNRNGRMIFGGLVPYDQVWRTGADASTKVRFSTPILIEGQSLDSGNYELFTIPGKTSWTIIFQENQSQWGSYRYNPDHDNLRITVIPIETKEVTETFTIGFEDITSRSAKLCLSWDQVKVPITLSVDLKQTVLIPLEAQMQQEGPKSYFRAAMFYFENDLDINRAAELMDLAIQERPNHLGMLYRQALILERKGDIPNAIIASEKSLEEAQKASGELKTEYTNLNTNLLTRLRK